MQDDERAIREVVDRWMYASRAGDLDTVLDLMTDDVLFLVPGQAPFGKQAFADNSRSMAGVAFDGTSEILELRLIGDHAYVRNHLRVMITPPGGSPVHHSGHTLTILRKEEGRWRLCRDANLVART